MDYSETMIFQRERHTLIFDPVNTLLLCRDTETGKKKWVKKIEDIFNITEISENENHYFVSFENDYNHGEFHAIDKSTGRTEWTIPGKCFLQKIFMNYLYMIFIDEGNRFHLLKVNPDNGDPVWHHEVDGDLSEYHMKKYSIILRYHSGKIERLDPENGEIIIKAESRS